MHPTKYFSRDIFVSPKRGLKNKYVFSYLCKQVQRSYFYLIFCWWKRKKTSTRIDWLFTFTVCNEMIWVVQQLVIDGRFARIFPWKPVKMEAGKKVRQKVSINNATGRKYLHRDYKNSAAKMLLFLVVFHFCVLFLCAKKVITLLLAHFTVFWF